MPKTTMVNVVLKEGNLSFSFTGVEFAEKYDDWQYYRTVFQRYCGPAKAVDFIVAKGDTLWLIEVKDYRTNRRKKKIDIADEVCAKVKDTLAGLASASFVAVDDRERKTACEALAKTKLVVAFHLEQPANPSRLFPTSFNLANVKLKLKQKLKFADAHPKLIDRNSFPAGLGTVSSV